MIRLPPRCTLTDPPFPYTSLFRSYEDQPAQRRLCVAALAALAGVGGQEAAALVVAHGGGRHASAGRDLTNRQRSILHRTIDLNSGSTVKVSPWTPPTTSRLLPRPTPTPTPRPSPAPAPRRKSAA